MKTTNKDALKDGDCVVMLSTGETVKTSTHIDVSTPVDDWPDGKDRVDGNGNAKCPYCGAWTAWDELTPHGDTCGTCKRYFYMEQIYVTDGKYR